MNVVVAVVGIRTGVQPSCFIVHQWRLSSEPGRDQVGKQGQEAVLDYCTRQPARWQMGSHTGFGHE